MSKLLNVEVVTRAQTLWAGSASHVSLPAVDGRLGVLPGRQPVLAVLSHGMVEVEQDSGATLKFEVTGGFASVDADFVTVVAEEGNIVEV